MSKKPFIVLIPGAWHTPAHYDELAKLLFQSGYDGVCEMNPSCDAKEPEAHTVVTDTVAIRDDILMPLIDDGEEIILVMHSYGGIPGIAAAAGLSKAELSIIGIDGGIIGLIFISTMIARAGTPLRSPDGFGPWVTDDEATGQLVVSNPKAMLYADVPSPKDQHAIAELRPQSKASVTSLSGYPAWLSPAYNRRRSYFVCLEDACFPSAAQQACLQESGVDWNVRYFKCGHSPFLSHPKELSAWIVEQAQAFEAVQKRIAKI